MTYLTIYQASTTFGLTTILNSGLTDRCRTDKKILFLTKNTLHDAHFEIIRTGFLLEKAQANFDQIIDFNELIHPIYPAHLQMKKLDKSTTEIIYQLICKLLKCDCVSEFYCESIQASPSLYLAHIFHNSNIHIYSDGLMVYSPTRINIPTGIAERIKTVNYRPFIRNCKPFLLIEAMPEYIELSANNPTPRTTNETDTKKYAPILFLGQCFSLHGICSETEELYIYKKAIEDIARLTNNSRKIIFKPHPSYPHHNYESVIQILNASVSQLVHIEKSEITAEDAAKALNPYAAVGIFTTSLFNIYNELSIPVYQTGTDELWKKLEPYSNSNRIPLLAASVIIPPIAHINSSIAQFSLLIAEGEKRFQRIYLPVAYAMQPSHFEPIIKTGALNPILKTADLTHDELLFLPLKKKKEGISLIMNKIYKKFINLKRLRSIPNNT